MKTIGIKIFTGLATVALLFSLSLHAFAGEGKTFKIDASKSTVKWTGEKVTGKHFGKINIKSGTLQIKDGKLQDGTVIMDMNSITCEDLDNAEYNAKLIGHLKSDDFFGVAKHPAAKLEITQVIPSKNGEIQVVGKLTIKGITHDIEFMVAESFSNGTYKATGTMKVNRTLYDIKYGSGSFFEGLGDKMIYDEFTLEFSVVAS